MCFVNHVREQLWKLFRTPQQSGRHVGAWSRGERHWRELVAEGGNDPDGGRAPGGAGATGGQKIQNYVM